MYAMGAAIPHLSRLAVSLPGILPHARDVIQTEVTTGSVEVRDEVLPDDPDEDIYLQTRVKATLNVVIKVDGGDDEEPPVDPIRRKRTRRGRKKKEGAGKGGKAESKQQLVFQEMDVDELEGAIEA